MKQCVFGLTCLFLSSIALATNEVKVLGITMLSDGDRDRPVTVFIDKQSSRAFMDPSSDRGETFLFDLNKSLVYSIDHEAEMAMKMDMLPKFVPDERLAPLSSKAMPGSLKVGAYNATRYDVNVKNNTCMSVYSSTALGELPGVREFFELYGRVFKLGNVGKVFKSLKNKKETRYCVYSKEYIYKNIAAKGVPLKLEENGSSVLEIVSIEDGLLGDKRMFLVPKAYQQTSMREQLIKAAEKRKNK